MADEVKEDLAVCYWGKGWTWLVSAFQGNAIAVKAEVDLAGKEYKFENLPEDFRYCHFTNVLFKPPHFFSFIPWPVEGLGLLDGVGWMQRKELPFLRKPTEQMIEEIEKIWAPAPAAPAITPATDVEAAVRDAKARRAMAKAVAEGPRLLK